jgi:hypothetical protein
MWSLLAKPDLNMPNKDTAIAAEYTLEPAAYRKKARASVVASGAAASTQEIEVLQGKLRRRAEALIDHFIESKTSCVLNCSFFSLSLSSFPSLAAVLATGLTSVGDH